MPAIVFLPFLTLPILAAVFLDPDMFVLFLVLFCVVGLICTSSGDPLKEAEGEDQRGAEAAKPERRTAPKRRSPSSGFHSHFDQHCPRAG